MAGSFDNGTVVTETTHSVIVLDPYGFYARCKTGNWISEYTPSKFKARQFGIMHDEDPERICHPHDLPQRGPQK